MTAVISERHVAPGEPPLGESRPRPAAGIPQGKVTVTDSVFRLVLRISGWFVLLVMLAVGVFLTFRALQAIQVAGWSFLTTQAWDPDAGAGRFGIAAVLVGTVLVALVAICFAFPLSFGTALFISEYAPIRLKRALITLVDLMAAVPSIVFGIWGFLLLQYQIVGVARWMSTYLSFIPFFRVDGADPEDPLSPATVFTSSTFIAGIVVALMVTPIATSVMREVFTQAPASEREGAYALGATKWGMIRAVVLPFGKGGVIGGTMLGLGRALGETIAVYLILSPIFEIQWNVLENGGSTVSALIALRYGEASQFAHLRAVRRRAGAVRPHSHDQLRGRRGRGAQSFRCRDGGLTMSTLTSERDDLRVELDATDKPAHSRWCCTTRNAARAAPQTAHRPSPHVRPAAARRWCARCARHYGSCCSTSSCRSTAAARLRPRCATRSSSPALRARGLAGRGRPGGDDRLVARRGRHVWRWCCGAALIYVVTYVAGQGARGAAAARTSTPRTCRTPARSTRSRAAASCTPWSAALIMIAIALSSWCPSGS